MADWHGWLYTSGRKRKKKKRKERKRECVHELRAFQRREKETVETRGTPDLGFASNSVKGCWGCCSPPRVSLSIDFSLSLSPFILFCFSCIARHCISGIRTHFCRRRSYHIKYTYSPRVSGRSHCRLKHKIDSACQKPPSVCIAFQLHSPRICIRPPVRAAALRCTAPTHTKQLVSTNSTESWEKRKKR